MQMNNILAVSKYYKIRDLAHAVKTGNKQAIQKAGELMSKLVPQSGCIFVPIPSHTGKATYTLEIANIIAQKTSGFVSNILSGSERETLYQQKLQGTKPQDVDLGMQQSNLDYPPEMLTTKPVYLVDNVVSSGETYKQAIKALINLLNVTPKMLVLGYVDDESIQQMNYKPIQHSLIMTPNFMEQRKHTRNIIITESQFHRLFEDFDYRVDMDMRQKNVQISLDNFERSGLDIQNYILDIVMKYLPNKYIDYAVATGSSSEVPEYFEKKELALRTYKHRILQ